MFFKKKTSQVLIFNLIFFFPEEHASDAFPHNTRQYDDRWLAGAVGASGFLVVSYWPNIFVLLTVWDTIKLSKVKIIYCTKSTLV